MAVRAATFTGFDPYKLTGVQLTDRKLGHGSYATVLELEYMGLKCAGKKIHELLLEQGDASYTVRRFEEECRLLSQVRHPNIVQFLGVHFQEGVRAPILVMEFLPTNLTSFIEQYDIVPKEISYSILHDVALGLCYLHSQTPPIIHRDLSSNNVLLTPNMTAKISDLGVTRILNVTPLQVSRMTQTPGTPAYMPPEVMVANPKYDTSIDEFSYGIMMIHMFSGQWPEPQVGQIRTELDGRMIPVSEAERREVFLQAIGNDHPLMDLIHRCISNNPKHRPCTEEILEHVSGLKQNYPSLFTSRLDMMRRIELLEKEKRTLMEEVEIRVQLKEQQILTLSDAIQQIEDKLDRQTFVHNNEIKELQQQIKNADAQTELHKGTIEGKDEELKTLTSQILASSEERRESEKKWTSQIEQLEIQLARERENVLTLQTENYYLLSKITKSIKTCDSLQEEVSALKRNTEAMDASMQHKTLDNEVMSKALKEKDVIISEKRDQLTKAMEYVINKKQVMLTSFDWKGCADLPVASEKSRGSTTIFNDKVYYGGGSSSHEKDQYTVCCYDPSQDKWITLPPLPVKQFSLGHINYNLIAVGGTMEHDKTLTVTERTYLYDDHLQRWKLSIPMPTARCSPGVLSLKSALIVAGGEIITRKTTFFGRISHVSMQLNIVELFKPDTSQWYRTNPLPEPCREISLAFMDDTCYAIGGLAMRTGADNELTLQHLNQALYASVDDLLGNAVPANQTTHSGRSDTQSAWKTLPNVPSRAHWSGAPAAAVLAGNYLLAISGESNLFGELKGIYMYHPSKNLWVCIGTPLGQSYSHVDLAVTVLSPLEILVINHSSKCVYRGTPLFFE